MERRSSYERHQASDGQLTSIRPSGNFLAAEGREVFLPDRALIRTPPSTRNNRGAKGSGRNFVAKESGLCLRGA